MGFDHYSGTIANIGHPTREQYGRLSYEHWEKVTDGQHAFLMRAFQETERHLGIHPGKAHLELAPILRGHFDRRLFVLREVLSAEGVDPRDIDCWIKVEEGMRRLIQADKEG